VNNTNQGMTLTAMIRSFVQYGVGAILASAPVMWILDAVTNEVGIPINVGAVRAWIEAAVFALVAGGLIKLGERFPVVNQIMSMGRSGSSPAYVPSGDTAVVATVSPEGGTTVYTEGPDTETDSDEPRYDEGYNPGDNPRIGPR